MANTKVRVRQSAFPTDTSTFDITVPAEGRNPTGVVVMCCPATAMNTDTVDLSWSFGVTDFTTVAQIGGNDEDNIGTAQDAHSAHQETNIIELYTPGTATIIRSATVAAISGGVRFTPLQSGSAHIVIVYLIFGSVCKAFSDGSGTLAASTFAVAHGMGTAPGLGFYGYASRSLTNAVDVEGSFGFHAHDGAGIKQASYAIGHDEGATTTANMLRGSDAQVGAHYNISGSTNHTFILTSNDATNSTYTVGSATAAGDLIGLLVECDDVTTDLLTVTSPTSSVVDWTYTGLAFQPQFVSMLLGMPTSMNTTFTNANAGTYAFFAMDEDANIYSMHFRSEDAIVLGTSDTANKVVNALRYAVSTSDGDACLMGPTFTFEATGWEFLAADITSVQGTGRTWPMIAVGESAGGGVVINRVLTESTVITDPTPGTMLKQRRPGDRVELLSDAIFIYTAFGRLVYDNFSVTDSIRLLNNLDKQLFDNVGTVDMLAILRRAFRHVVDIIVVGDSIRRDIALGRLKIDTLSVNDAVSLFRNRYVLSLNTVNLSDNVVKTVTAGQSQQTFVVLVDDFVQITDTPILFTSGVRDRVKSDSIATAEFKAIARFRRALLLDDVGMIDANTVSRTRQQLGGTDTITAADSLQPVRRRRRQMSDAGTDFNDSITKVSVRSRTLFQFTDEFGELVFDSNDIAISDDVIVTRSAIFNSVMKTDSLELVDRIVTQSGILHGPEVNIITGIESQ